MGTKREVVATAGPSPASKGAFFPPLILQQPRSAPKNPKQSPLSAWLRHGAGSWALRGSGDAGSGAWTPRTGRCGVGRDVLSLGSPSQPLWGHVEAPGKPSGHFGNPKRGSPSCGVGSQLWREHTFPFKVLGSPCQGLTSASSAELD